VNDERARGTAASWDREYAAGLWDHLDSMDEVSHYMVIAGYALYAPRAPSVLDVGCGHGRLLAILGRLGITSYHGVDLSQEALDRAAALGVPDASFEAADFTTWRPPRRYDVVIFNESLYYAPSPTDVMARTREWVVDDGMVVVSMWRHRDVGRIWRQLAGDPGFTIVAGTAVQRSRRQRWDVKALRPIVAG